MERKNRSFPRVVGPAGPLVGSVSVFADTAGFLAHVPMVRGDDAPHDVTLQVVVEASPEAKTVPTVEDDDRTAGWVDEVPDDGGDDRGDAVADVRRLL